MNAIDVENWDMARLGDKYERLRVARDLFPLCVCCGADLSAERLTSLVYIPDRNRFAHSTCPPKPQEQRDAAD